MGSSSESLMRAGLIVRYHGIVMFLMWYLVGSWTIEVHAKNEHNI